MEKDSLLETIPAKTIVTRTKSIAWFGAQYNMNIYRGCCHGCIYCDSRSECYGTEDFDRVRYKENALETIRNDLRRKVRAGVISTGAMSDPYNPFEEQLELTRHALELVAAYEFGIAIATKSTLITRDIDILQEIKERSPVLCKLTITTCDDAMARKIEPGAPLSSERFTALKQLSDAGLFVGVLLMPVLPFVTDTEKNIRGIVRRAKECGARFVYPSFGVTLRRNQRQYYYEQLEQLFPGERLQERYQKQYGNQYNCGSPDARHLFEVFREECDTAGLLYKIPEIIEAYKLGYQPAQLTFFD